MLVVPVKLVPYWIIPGAISNRIGGLLCAAGVAHLYSHVSVYVSCACQARTLLDDTWSYL